MDFIEAARRIANAPKGFRIATFGAFVFVHAEELDSMSPVDVVRNLGMSVSFATEVSKIIRMKEMLKKQGELE